VPATRRVEATNPNLSIRCEDEDATYIMTMGSAIVEHILGDIIHTRLHGKLDSIAGGPNIRYMLVLARNRIFVRANFSIGRLPNLGIWIILEDIE